MGDQALIVEFGDRIDAALSAHIAALARQLRESQPIGVLDIVPAYTTLALHYDPAAVGSGASPYEALAETIGAWLKLFLIECNGHCTLDPATNPQNTEVGRSLVQQFKQLVESNFHEWHQVKHYALSLNVSPNYLNEVIKSNINIPAKDYIQHRLILEAKRMALFTGKSSKEIGFDLGFEDPSHFSKFFKSFTGRSLQQFKDSH